MNQPTKKSSCYELKFCSTKKGEVLPRNEYVVKDQYFVDKGVLEQTHDHRLFLCLLTSTTLKILATSFRCTSISS